MIVSAEKVFEFAMPDAFVAAVNCMRSNAVDMECSVAESAVQEAENLESVSLFTVTENDFEQMARFDKCVQQLKYLANIYMRDASQWINMMQIGGSRQQRAEAMNIHSSLGAYIDDIDSCNRRYFELCRNMKGFCGRIDELTKWYIAAVDEVAGVLDDVVAAGFKYSNLADGFAQAGKDISVVEKFFDRWSEMVTKLTKESQTIENDFRHYYEYCNNDLPKIFQSIPPTMESLNNLIRQNQFVQFLMVSSHYNNIMNVMRCLKEDITHMSLPALNNMVIYLSHIGTYYNGIVVDIHSAKTWLLNANDAKFVRTAIAQLTSSKNAWLACEDASQRFVKISAGFIK